MKWKVVFSIVGLFLISCLSFVIYYGKKEMDIVAFDSCIRSIHGDVIEAVGDSSISLINTGKWTYMDINDIQQLENRAQFGDCKQLPSNQLIDIWGENIRIVYRISIDDKPEFRVWSKGKDRVAGTNDDIISPLGSLDSVKHLANTWP